MPIIYIPAAVFFSTASLVLLFFAWKKITPSHLHLYFIIAGWAGLWSGFPLWSEALGTETGSIVALCAPALIAWLLILLNLEIRKSSSRKYPSNSEVRSYRRNTSQGKRNYLLHLCRFFLVTLLSLFAALAFSVALTRVLGMNIENAMATTVLTLPFVWGLAAWWSASDDQLWRPAAGLICISTFCTIVAIA